MSSWGCPPGYHQAQLEIAATFRRMGLYAEALATLNRLSEHFARSHDGFGSARLSDQLAMVYLQTGRYQDALGELERSAAFYNQPQYLIEHAERMVMQAEALLGLDRPADAGRLLAQAAKVLSPDVDPILHAHLELVRARLRVEQQEPAPALRALEKIEPILKVEGHVRFLLELYWVRSRALELQGDYPAALAALREHLVQEQRLDQLLREQSTAWVRGEFELARQEGENERLRVEQRLQQQELEQVKERRFWLLVVMVLCGVLALLTMGWLLDRNRRMRRLAFTDELTGINNRRRVLRQGSDMLALRLAGRARHFVCWCSISITSSGSTIPWAIIKENRVLQWRSRAADRQLRHQDQLGRTGGEEFLILLPDTSLEEACRVAERIRHSVANRALPGMSYPVTISIGCASLPDDDQDLAALIQRADNALYRAKEAGRNRVEQTSDGLGIVTQQGVIAIWGAH
ncbi:tetratricopeptide repeat-containing diguanylate cyclase [Aeromonas caviae]